ncbi:MULTISPECIES: LPS export ABC transporter periplasmic protein LptC [Desulfococcus]|jgi:LPS export ABC transporter protein LptC|nr:LPS export ABC transporter periplasmic protein LptC [Desulfococcus multivorans]AQV00189.1 LPS export ABC transporter periplasmic protein LptC [Desulfococcus multivorans]MDX9819835.1 LPS export ABC transporter periplasmic protein LptC [Desulfococcus multivorans]
MMKNNTFKKIKVILLLFITITLVAVIAVFTGYRHLMDEEESLVSTVQEGAGMAISSVRQTAVRNGMLEWSLNAASAEYLNAENQAVFTLPSVTFFMEGREEIVMTAAKGTVRTDSNNISVSGDVVVRDATYELRTEVLNYDNAEHRFFTNLPVVLSGAGFDLTADSASLDMKTRQAILEGNVKGILSEDIEL